VTPTQLERRLSALEGAVARLRPPAPVGDTFGWLQWLSCEELNEVQRCSYEPDHLAQLRLVELETTALRRQLSGAPEFWDLCERTDMVRAWYDAKKAGQSIAAWLYREHEQV